MTAMREVVACVVWLVAGAVIIAAMFTHTTLWVSLPIVFGAIAATAIALPGQKSAADSPHNCQDPDCRHDRPGFADHAGRP
jgi:hypothetical protein